MIDITYMQAVLVCSSVSAIGTSVTAWYLRRIFKNACRLAAIANDVKCESMKPPALQEET